MAGRHAHHGGRGGGVSPVLLVLLLVAVLAGAGWLVLRPGTNTAAADECSGETPVVLSVVPQMESAVERSLSALREDEPCFPAEVRVESPKDVESSFFNGGRPDVWIADSPARVARLNSIGINTTVLSDSLAVSPIGLAAGPTVEAPDSWLEAFESNRMVMSDPEQDGATAQAIMGPTLERKATGAPQDRTQAVVVTAAQSYGVRAVEGNGDVQPVGLDEIGTTFTQLIPVSEQELLTRGAGIRNLEVVTPRSGAPVLSFPMVLANGGAERSEEIGRAVAEWLASDAGEDALAESGLRTPDGAPIEGRGMGEVTLFDEAPADVFNEVLGAWQVLSVPSSILAVFDASGSMDFPAGGGKTRVDLAVGAALTALEVFPQHARIGVWAFSIDQGGPGQDWRELAPMRRLNERTQGRSHEQFLRSQVPTLRRITKGGTGLYDTTLEAYKKALRAYDSAFFNAVILMSDGANDDPGSIELEELLRELEKLRDPERPVRIISVGISSDADLPSLERISKATGGQAYLAEDPRDILDVFAEALMTR